MSSNTTVWTNADDFPRWWEAAEDGLFLIFDTSAHINGGVPNVSPGEVRKHIAECATCQDAGITVTDNGDGTATVENL
jgi:hypothetical protein